jgi:hypothetical protein
MAQNKHPPSQSPLITRASGQDLPESAFCRPAHPTQLGCGTGLDDDESNSYAGLHKTLCFADDHVLSPTFPRPRPVRTAWPRRGSTRQPDGQVLRKTPPSEQGILQRGVHALPRLAYSADIDAPRPPGIRFDRENCMALLVHRDYSWSAHVQSFPGPAVQMVQAVSGRCARHPRRRPVQSGVGNRTPQSAHR